MDIKDLEQIIELLKQNDITEFELNKEGIQLKLSRARPEVRVMAAPGSHNLEPAIVQTPYVTAPYPGAAYSSGGHSAAQPAGEGAGQPAPAQDNLVKVESPLVGTFYRKPSPDAEFFVQEGSSVKKGDTLCIVEAMKLMNEIDAPVSGRIEKILVGDGEVVEFGEVMFLINPGG